MKNILIVILFIAAAAGGIFAFQTITKEQQYQKEPYAKQKPCPYKNLNPLRCEPDLAKKKKEYVVLRNELLDFLESEKKAGSILGASVYFRDLQNGPVLSIEGQQNFVPASLLKVPLMITYYKKAETDPGLLKNMLTVDGDIASLSQNIPPKRFAEKGKTYTIDELIDLLVTQSDNTSWKMLLANLRKNYSEEDLISTLSDLGIIDPRKRSDQQYITAQSYASIFRILYNSSYLNLEMSDKALGLLTNSVFKEGIVAGVPTGTKVAHKFGEQKNGNEQQLHDCGIVYYPQNPYVLCVMTKGKDIAVLESVIKQVSKKVYQEVEERN